MGGRASVTTERLGRPRGGSGAGSGCSARGLDPGQPPGFEIEQVDGVWTSVGDLAQDYRSVPEEFVPYMQAAGVSEELIGKLMHGNPWNAFSR